MHVKRLPVGLQCPFAFDLLLVEINLAHSQSNLVKKAQVRETQERNGDGCRRHRFENPRSKKYLSVLLNLSRGEDIRLGLLWTVWPSNEKTNRGQAVKLHESPLVAQAVVSSSHPGHLHLFMSQATAIPNSGLHLGMVVSLCLGYH